MEKRYLSNKIDDAYKRWPEDSDIIITSPTGSGLYSEVLRNVASKLAMEINIFIN